MFFKGQKLILKNFSFIKKMHDNVVTSTQRARRVKENVSAENYSV